MFKFVNLQGEEVKKEDAANWERWDITMETKCKGGCLSAYSEKSLTNALNKVKSWLKEKPSYCVVTITQERKAKECDYHVYGFNGNCLV